MNIYAIPTTLYGNYISASSNPKTNISINEEDILPKISIPAGRAFDSVDYYYASAMSETSLHAYSELSLESAVRQSYVININDNFSNGFPGIEERLRELRTTGVSANLDFNAIEKYHLALYSDYELSADLSIDNLINELSASYVTLKNMIDENYTGDEQDVQSNELERIFAEHSTRLAESFAANVTALFSDINEYDKLYTSTKAAIDEQVSIYSDYVSKNADYANLAGTEDEWLSGHYRYMSTMLQQAAGASENKTLVSDNYSISELREISLFSKTSSKINQQITCAGSEEEFGFRLGLMLLKADYLSTSSNVSQSYKDALNRAVNKTVEESIKHMDADYENARKTSFAPDSADRFPELDMKAIYSIINLMQKSYAESKNLLTAIIDGITEGESKYKSKSKDSEYSNFLRYSIGSSGFWDRMYSPQQIRGYTHSSIMTQIEQSLYDTLGVALNTGVNSYV